MADPYKLIVKLFAADDTFAPAEFVPIFHKWIQQKSLPGHLLIDVADYAHVPDGPGTLLVSSEANIHMDRGEGRLGVMYVRKLPIAGATSIGQVLHGVFTHALTAADLLERDPSLAGRLRFRTDEISVRFNDRLLAPNTPEVVADFLPHVAAAAEQLFGRPVKVTPHNTSPRQLLELRVTAEDAPPVAGLLERAGGRRQPPL
jgi:hypothetical protein